MISIPEIMMPILHDLRTKDERDLLRENIRELEGALFRSDPGAIEKILSSHFSKHLASAMRDILQHQNFKNNPETVKKFFEDLRDIGDKLPLLKLSIAFKPSEGMITRLHEWIKENLGSGILLDISYDGSILGGARMIFRGRYKEMTLAQMITSALVKEKISVMELVK